METRYQYLYQLWYQMPMSLTKTSNDMNIEDMKTRYERAILKTCRRHGQDGLLLYKEFMNQHHGIGCELRLVIANDRVCYLYMDILAIMISFAYILSIHQNMAQEGSEGNFCRTLSRKIFSGLERVHEYLLRIRYRLKLFL